MSVARLYGIYCPVGTFDPPTQRATMLIRASGLLLFPAPGDYVAVTEDLTFSASDTRICRNVTSEDDTILEEDEDFTLTLTTTDGSVTLTPDVVTVTLLDNDCKHVF